MSTSPYTLLTEEEYLFGLRQKIDALKARIEEPRYKYAQTEQAKVVAHFLDRAIQIGEATYRVRDLPVPLDIFLRVLCDDLIRLVWVTTSESNAAEYAKTPISEMAKMLRLTLEKHHGRVTNTQTGQDATAQVLPQLQQFESKGKSIEQMANDCGLEKLYTIVFRFSSLAVHGNTYDLHHSSKDSSVHVLPAVVAFLRTVALIADNYPHRSTSAAEVFGHLGLEKIGKI